MSFRLNIEHAPFPSFHWWADYNEARIYSGWLDVYLTGKGEPWECPYGAYGATDLSVCVVDADYDTIHLKEGLGPIYDDHDYIYNCDTEELRDITPEVVAGTINRKELEHDGAYDSIPVYNVPQDERGLVHIWGRNDMASAQRMGIHWIVRDPDGYTVEEHSEWEMWPYTSPGSSHPFIGGRFDLDKPGTYTINIALSMNPDDPEIVDTYYGTLCTVAAAVPESEFKGFGIEEYQTV